MHVALNYPDNWYHVAKHLRNAKILLWDRTFQRLVPGAATGEPYEQDFLGTALFPHMHPQLTKDV